MKPGCNLEHVIAYLTACLFIHIPIPAIGWLHCCLPDGMPMRKMLGDGICYITTKIMLHREKTTSVRIKESAWRAPHSERSERIATPYMRSNATDVRGSVPPLRGAWRALPRNATAHNARYCHPGSRVGPAISGSTCGATG